MATEITSKEPLEEQLLHFAERLTHQNGILLNAIIRMARLPAQSGGVPKEQINAIFIETMAKIS